MQLRTNPAADAGRPAVGSSPTPDGRARAAGRPSLRLNATRALSGNVMYAATQWGLLVVLAKLTDAAAVGAFSLGLAITAPVILFANLHLRTLQATDTGGRYTGSDYLTVRVATTTAALCVIAAIAILGDYDPARVWIIVVIGVAKAIEAISDVLYGALQQAERMGTVATSLLLRGVAALTLGAIGLGITRDAIAAAGGMAIGWLIVLVTFDLPRSGVQFRFSPSAALLPLVRGALPLAFVALMVSLVPNIPRYFLEETAGAAALGRYAGMAYFIVAGTTVINAVAQAASPRLSAAYDADRRGFGRLLGKLVAFGAAAGAVFTVVALAVGDEVLALAYTREYAGERVAFAWLMAAGGASYIATFCWYGLVAARALAVQLPLFASVVGVATVGCAVLIPTRGVEGAAMALFAAMVYQSLASALLLSRYAGRVGSGRGR